MKQINQRRSFLITILSIIAGLLVIGGGTAIFFSQTSKTAITPPSKITVAGSGSAGFAFGKWAEYYEKKNPDVYFEFLPSADTAVGILGVKEKTLDIGVSSRKSNPEEEFPEMIITNFAKDAVVFIVNKSVTGVKNLTGQQLKDIYTGKITNWQEVGGEKARIVIIDREEAESSKKMIRNFFLKQEKVSANAIEVYLEKDVLSIVVSTPNSIGYLSYGRARTADVLVLSLNGLDVEQGTENATYPLIRDYSVITRSDSSKAVKDFVAFLKGEGKNLTEQFFYFEP